MVARAKYGQGRVVTLSWRWLGPVWAVGLALAVVPPAPGQQSPGPGQPAARQADTSGLRAAAAFEEAVVQAIAKAERSVVAIARVDPAAAKEVAPGDDLRLAFERFPPGKSAAPGPADPDFIPQEFGSGVIVDRAGLVLTNAHVVHEGSEHWIYTSQRRVYKTKIKALDSRSDLAILEVEGADDEGTVFEPISLGDASRVRKGQFVVALGNPYAIARDGQASASWGIVANLSRKAGPLPADGPETDGKDTLHHFGTLIQTDCRLNLGTSGGALVNLKGEMIGLTTAMAAIAGYEQSAGFAIPVDDAFRRVLDALRKGEEVEYGFLGISRDNLMADERLRGKQGVRVNGVQSHTPAAKAGLRNGDVIVSFDGRPLFDTDSLMLELARLGPAAAVELTVERQSFGEGRPNSPQRAAPGRAERRQVRAVLAKYQVRGRQVVTAARRKWRGLRVDFPTARRRFEPGVIVVEVDAGSPAERAGLRVDDAIVVVGTEPVESPEHFYRAATAGGGAVAIKRRAGQGGEERVVTVEAE